MNDGKKIAPAGTRSTIGVTPPDNKEKESLGVKAKHSVVQNSSNSQARSMSSSSVSQGEALTSRLERLRAENEASAIEQSKETLRKSGLVDELCHEIASAAVMFEVKKEQFELLEPLQRTMVLSALREVAHPDWKIALGAKLKEKYDSKIEQSRIEGLKFIHESVIEYYCNPDNRREWLDYQISKMKKQSSANSSSCICF